MIHQKTIFVLDQSGFINISNNTDNTDISLFVKNKKILKYNYGNKIIAYITGSFLQSTINFNNKYIISSVGLNFGDGKNEIYINYDIINNIYLTLISNGDIIFLIPTSIWNIDKFDGSGPSNLSINKNNFIHMLLNIVHNILLFAFSIMEINIMDIKLILTAIRVYYHLRLLIILNYVQNYHIKYHKH